MTCSARNQLTATVTAVVEGSVNSEVLMTLGGGQDVAAIVTRESVRNLGLASGSKVVVLLKASWVLLAVGEAKPRISARNILGGTIVEIHVGAVNTEVVLEVAGGDRIVSVVTKESVATLDLRVGSRIWAVFKASSPILSAA